MPPRPLVIAGPSGVGKGTLHQKLRDEFPDAFALSVSHTTRKPREKLNEKFSIQLYSGARLVLVKAEVVENIWQSNFPLSSEI